MSFLYLGLDSNSIRAFIPDECAGFFPKSNFGEEPEIGNQHQMGAS
jgi:hypothetical protein